jgi:hypothetical protein
MELATFDIETDPFKYGRKPEAFAIGFYSKKLYKEFWGENCLFEFVNFLSTTDNTYRIYAHNGGKFDFYYLYYKKILNNPIKIINGRIVKAKIFHHELRDSYAAVPIPLSKYKKDSIDYDLFESHKREKHKNDILHYLAKDCEYLYELIESFIIRFGLQLTIGGAAIKQLKKFHPFTNTTESHDNKFRPYYFGGRVQCFKKGIIKGKLKYYDVNSMYPSVMKNCMHPEGMDYNFYSGENAFKQLLTNKFYFIKFVGYSKGALPIRTNNGLDFPTGAYEFNACSHEVKFGILNKLIKIEYIEEMYVCNNLINFSTFVDIFMQEKITEKGTANEIFAKLLMNSSYGKTGQNPENFYEWLINYDNELVANKWELYIDMNDIEIFRCPSTTYNYYDVAIASSITSAARTVLLNGIMNSVKPIYCDTDSLLCEKLENCPLSPTELGAWDLENEGEEVAIAGKKMYAFKTNNGYKISSKGCVLSAKEIYKIANGGTVTYKKEAPTFKLTGACDFIKRDIVMT